MHFIRIPIALLSFLCFTTLSAKADGWLTDYDAALASAAKQNKKVLLDFTGSDWCPGCIRLKKQVFDMPQFKDFADKNLVLVEIDKPYQKTLPAKLAKQNEELADQYQIDKLPTIILLSPQGKILKQQSIFMDGPQGFIDWVNSGK
ncbi:MAG: thioredoxin family protein [Verrucomicrobia bacterium]|nr:thioredoxin family protein [Verrucomicrobiota bacterium]